MNKASLLLGAMFLAVVGGLLWGQGCQIDDIVQVPVPDGMRGALSLEEKVSYSEAQYVTEDWKHFFRMNTWRWDDNVADAAWVVATFKAIVNIGVQEGAGVLGAVPGGAGIAALLAFFWGKYQDRPGARDREREAEERGRRNGNGIEVGRG